MYAKNYLIAVIVVLVVYTAVGYMIHEVLLRDDYRSLQLERPYPEVARRSPLFYLAALIFSLAFCGLYARTYHEDRNWFTQGVGFGLLAGTLLAPIALVGYVALPAPGGLLIKVIVYNYIHLVVAALFAAALYRIPAQAAIEEI